MAPFRCCWELLGRQLGPVPSITVRRRRERAQCGQPGSWRLTTLSMNALGLGTYGVYWNLGYGRMALTAKFVVNPLTNNLLNKHSAQRPQYQRPWRQQRSPRTSPAPTAARWTRGRWRYATRSSSCRLTRDIDRG